MSSDLISRQALIRSITKQYDTQFGQYSLIEMIGEVEKEPTAYDVDKVIEQLKKCRDDVIAGLKSNYCLSQCKNDDCVVCIFNKVSEIVRKGGIEK